MFATTPSIVMTLACSIDGWKFQSSTPCVEQLVDTSASPASCTNRLSACGPGQQDLHLHAAVGRVAEPLGELVVGHEVRGRDAHALRAPTAAASGTGWRCRSSRSPTRRARTARSTRRAWAGPGSGRCLRRRARDRSRPSCRGTRRAARRPRGRGCGSACRATRARCAASPCHSSAMPTPPVNAIDSSTMSTLRCVRWFTDPSCSRRSGRNQRMITPAASISSIEGPLHRVRAPRVEEHAHPHAGLRPCREAARELGADLAAPVHEREEVDRVLGCRRSRRASPGRSRRRCGGRRCGCPRSPARR